MFLKTAGTADNQHVFVSRRLGVLGAAVHRQAFRLRQNDVVGEYRVHVRPDVLFRSPARCAVLRAVPVFLRVLRPDKYRQPQRQSAQQAKKQIAGIKAGVRRLQRRVQRVHQV